MLTSLIALVNGRTDITLPPGSSTRSLLVWIVHLAGGSGAYRSTIDHIGYQSLAA